MRLNRGDQLTLGIWSLVNGGLAAAGLFIAEEILVEFVMVVVIAICVMTGTAAVRAWIADHRQPDDWGSLRRML